MERKILLPTDFSNNSWNAIVYALKLYANENCKFYFLNSIKIKASTMSNFSNKLSETMRKNAMKDLLKMKKMIERVHINAKHSFEIILSNEDLKDAIESAIEKHQIEMVVMGTKGASGAKEFFFGSNTVKIISKMRDCPILTIPEDFDFVVPKQIAFPTDFNHFYDDELLPLQQIAKLYNSKIEVVHINEKDNLKEVQNHNLSILNANLQDHPHTFHWMPSDAKISNEINDFIEEKDIDILAIINYKHSFIESIIKEPIIKKIGFHPIIPFLVIPSQN